MFGHGLVDPTAWLFGLSYHLIRTLVNSITHYTHYTERVKGIIGLIISMYGFPKYPQYFYDDFY